MAEPTTEHEAAWPGQELWKEHLQRLGGYLKAQRQFSQLSQRQVASMANLSDTYMSQLERGLHEPSIRVLRALATSLGLDPEELIRRAATVDGEADATSPPGSHSAPSTETAIRNDARLSETQKRVLLSVLQSYLDEA